MRLFTCNARKTNFPVGFMARGEIELARTLNPMKIGDYKDIKESRRIFHRHLYAVTVRKKNAVKC